LPEFWVPVERGIHPGLDNNFFQFLGKKLQKCLICPSTSAKVAVLIIYALSEMTGGNIELAVSEILERYGVMHNRRDYP